MAYANGMEAVMTNDTPVTPQIPWGVVVGIPVTMDLPSYIVTMSTSTTGVSVRTYTDNQVHDLMEHLDSCDECTEIQWVTISDATDGRMIHLYNRTDSGLYQMQRNRAI